MPFYGTLREPIQPDPLFPDRAHGETLTSQLARGLRSAIESGFFPPASRLLSSRELAKRFGLARNTVTSVLEQLVAEGYLEARVGAGTFVAAKVMRPRERRVATKRKLPQRAAVLSCLQPTLDVLGSTSGPLGLGTPDLTEFPMRTWQRLGAKRLSKLDAHLNYGEYCGSRELREAISRHLAQFRGVVVEAEQVVIVEGAQAAFNLVSFVLTQPGDRVVIEDPAYPRARATFEANGLTLRSVSVDDDGLRTAELPPVASFAYVTPSHQFPLGGAMPISRRLELLGWARRANAYVVEDDYDSEFSAHPLPALQSLDRDERVIYIGTFSKTLAPGLRLGYIVTPPHLTEAFRIARKLSSLGVSAHLQGTLTDFITQGAFVRHVRRMARIYERRRQILIDTLSKGLPANLKIGPADTGLHIAITGAPDFDDAHVARSMDGQRFVPLSALCVNRTDCRGLILGCSAGNDEAVRRAASAVTDALRASSDQLRAAVGCSPDAIAVLPHAKD